MSSTVIAAFILFTATLVQVQAETHTISFDNQCGYGTPKLIQGNDVLTSTSYTVKGSFSSAIAYLDTGDCLFNGEGCTVVEMTLVNPTSAAGSGSSADITLIAPLAFSVATAFEFTGSCSGMGASCSDPKCSTAFFHPDDTWVQVACQADDADLVITFCGDGSGSDSSSSSASEETSTSSQAEATTSKSTPTTTSKVHHTSTQVYATPDIETSSSAAATTSSEVVAAAAASASSTSSSSSGYRTRPSCSKKRSKLVRKAVSSHKRRSHAGNDWN